MESMKISHQKEITLSQIKKLEAKIKTIIVKNAHNGISKNETLRQLINLILQSSKEFDELSNSKYYIDSAKYWANVYVNNYYKKIDAIRQTIILALILLRDKAKEDYQMSDKNNISNANRKKLNKKTPPDIKDGSQQKPEKGC